MTALRNISITLGRPLGATLLFLTLLLAASLAVAASWADLSSSMDERDANADLLARSVVASRRVKLSSPSADADPFVAGDSGTLGAAGVDTLIRTTAVEAGCSVLSIKAEVKPEESGPPGRIEAQAVVEGQNDAIQAMLLKLEGGSPTILVDELSIEPADVAANGSDPQAPRLRMSLTVSAFWKLARH